jgi:hypothetical protein
MTPRITSVVAHDKGAQAAIWLLTRLEQGDEQRRTLLIEWCKLLLERKELISALDISGFLIRRSSDSSPEIASRVVGCLARLIEGDKEAGLECVRILHGREDLLVKRAMADTVTRLFRRIGEGAVSLLNDMLDDEDESVLAAASATVGDLRFIDQELWANRIKELCSHPVRIVRRNLVLTLRDYLEAFPIDEREIIPALWEDGDEVVMTRLRELLLRMEEVDPDRFATTLKSMKDLNLESLWAPLEVRRSETVMGWKKWLAGEGEVPARTPEKPQIHISDMSEAELPELDDALASLDDLGFLD